MHSIWQRLPHPFFAQGASRPWVVAHRGGGAENPENTLQAFIHAASLGVDMLECDVYRIADGRFVVMHDAHLDRTTDAVGPVVLHTTETLRKVDAAYRWARPEAPDAYPWRGRGVSLPFLEELLAQFPLMRFSIELKQDDPTLAAPLVALIQRHKAQDRVVIGSFGHRVIQAVRECAPTVATQATRRETLLFLLLVRLRLARFARPRFNAFAIPQKSGKHLTLVDAAFLRAAHYHGVPVHVWTVNDAVTMERLWRMGVDGIITDRPTLAMAGKQLIH
ncbi:MAG: glycerophosphodiester phosphodiesterase [Verrucomicrobiota bacterium]|nr:glycerophosphodiester phosphodiesterase [Verrucomicrobiota bacterium]